MQNRTINSGIDKETANALALSRSQILSLTSIPIVVHDTNETLIKKVVSQFIEDYHNALISGREHVVFIMPVGPVGQYPLIADYFNVKKINLKPLVLIFMDEYLDIENNYISIDDPLSFRKHIKEEFWDKLNHEIRPLEDNIVFPDPKNPEYILKLINKYNGLDYCYAGVGITGHLAFNDPVEHYADPYWFANLGTRIVHLSERTRVINSVTACRGNIERIPSYAITVGMKEILMSKQLRLWLNRDWQSAAIRRLLFGPITASFPASLIQNHPSVSIDVVEIVLQSPEPGLR